MLRTVIVEQKSSQSGRRKTITRTFEHELNPSERARLDKSELNKHSEQASEWQRTPIYAKCLNQ